jgi:hypothetical protein
MILNSPFISGSLTVTGNTIISGSITAPQGIAGTASYASNAELLDGLDSTSFTTTSSFNAASSSFSTRVANTEATASQYIAASASFDSRIISNDATDTTQNSRIAANEAKTGSFATTGSNFFIGTQVVTGSVFISSDLVVQGSSSLQNITASAVSVGTNRIILNTATPILPFGGISVQDSGSTMGRSGSLLWNSITDHWINVNPSGSDEGYNSAMVINGPKNTGSLGSEAGLTTNYIPVSQGEDHITDSVMFQSGTNIGVGTTSPAEKLVAAGAIMSTGGITGHGANRTTISQEGSSNGAFWQSYGADTSTVGRFTLRQASSDFSVTRTPLIIEATGAATFSSTVKSKGLVVVGASGGYGTGDNTYINLGGEATTDNFGAINMPFGDVMKFNSYHGYQFKTSNSTASPVTMFSIGIGGAATFVSSVQAASLIVAGSGYFPAKLITLGGAEFSRYNTHIGTTIVDGSKIALSFGTRSNNVDYDNTLNILNGNVGIGTTSPSSILNVHGTTGITWAGNGVTSGLVTIGTPLTGGSLFVNTISDGGSGYQSGLAIDGNSASQISTINIKALGVKFGGFWGSNLAFHVSNGTSLNEAMRITRDGEVKLTSGISNRRLFAYDGGSGNTNGLGLDMGGNSYEYSLFFAYGTSDNGRMTAGSWDGSNVYRTKFTLFGNGNYSFAGSNVSDVRLKESINVLDINAIDKLNQLVPKTYHMTDNQNLLRYGFIAQEVQEILPDLINGVETEDTYLGLDYNGILAVAVKAIQELSAKNDALEARLSALETA